MRTAPSRAGTIGTTKRLKPYRSQRLTTVRLIVCFTTTNPWRPATTGSVSLKTRKMTGVSRVNVKWTVKTRDGRGPSSTTALRIATVAPMKTMEPVPWSGRAKTVQSSVSPSSTTATTIAQEAKMRRTSSSRRFSGAATVKPLISMMSMTVGTTAKTTATNPSMNSRN